MIENNLPKIVAKNAVLDSFNIPIEASRFLMLLGAIPLAGIPGVNTDATLRKHKIQCV